jgi:hypothetical protein
VIEHVVRVAAESETALNEVGGLTIRRSLIPRLLVPAQRQRTPPTAAAARLAGWLAGWPSQLCGCVGAQLPAVCCRRLDGVFSRRGHMGACVRACKRTAAAAAAATHR